MVKINLSYIAGLFDGEGSVNSYKRKESGKIRIQSSITNTNLEILEIVSRKLKIGSVFKNVDTRANFPVHRWQVSDGHAYLFLKKILPYLYIKQKKTKEIIKEYESNNWRKIKYFTQL